MGKKQIPVVSIDTSVPIPERAIYPLAQLEVGDSFLFPADKRGSVQTRASKVKRDTGREFVVRKINKDECRIWRTK